MRNPFSTTLLGRAGLAACLATALAAVPPTAPARADMAAPDDTSGHTIEVAKDKSAAFRLDYPVGEIVVAQPDMLQLVATTDHTFYIRGKAFGVTNLLIYDQHHRLAQVIDVRIGQDIESLQADIATALPGEHIVASNFAGGVLLSGAASSTAAAERAQSIAEHYAPKAVSSTIAVANTQQIMVEVRFIEASRTSLKDVGFNFSAGSGPYSISSGTGLAGNQPPQSTLQIGGKIGAVSVSATLEALEQKGVVRTLAKPNLMAMSGQEASFLAGGEIPYPIPNGINGVTVDFRPYGVTLKVTPTIEDNGDIKLQVAPEVSQLDPSTSINISGFSLPGLIESKASTTVELRDGQSFAVAGLFQQQFTDTVHQIPGASSLPVIGALFRSTNWQHQQTELIIIVTPHLVAPTSNVNTLPNPLAERQEPSAIDLILEGMVDRPAPAPGAGR